jgi:hypothetical protein
MSEDKFYFYTISDPHTVITPIHSGTTFPEFLEEKLIKYKPFIEEFGKIVEQSETSSQVLEKIRDKSTRIDKNKRMSFLKIFRRCVSPVCDTEATKKITKIPTSVFIENYGHTFKPIEKLKKQFANISNGQLSALSVLIGEYDNRGEQGYVLTDLFFTWFEETFKHFSIEGPRGAGKDIQLNSVFEEFRGEYPCDFVIKEIKTSRVLAIGFARYDSTRGGAQSDDRTGGNADKVSKAKQFGKQTEHTFKLIFLADGPGLTHKDTWEEACRLDGDLNGRVRVTTLKTSPHRITQEWLLSD